jgi:beta-glucosidase
MLDVCRDPRWGRIEESYGEDPYLTSRFGVAIVKGLQGTDGIIGKDHIVATVKHFAGYGLTEGGLNKTPAPLSERTMREVVLPPFKAAITEAGALSVMPSYNEIDGIPAHANKWLLMDVLRTEWGFKGYVVSDYGGVVQLSDFHHLALNDTEAGKIAMLAGVDMELDNPYCYSTLLESMQGSQELRGALERAVRGILTVKFKLGLFEDPYVEPEVADQVNRTGENLRLSLKVAEESVVLLKNSNGILPLDKSKYKRIAVIGPHANTMHYGGYAHHDTRNGITFYEGIKRMVGDRIDVLHAEGCRIHEGDGYWLTSDYDEFEFSDPEENRGRIKEAVKLARKSDLIILAVGGTAVTCGEFIGYRHSLDLFGDQNELVDALIKTNVPIVACLVNGRPLTINVIDQHADAVLETWYLGEQAGVAGEVNPSGKLTISFPKSVGHLPVYYSKKSTGIHDYFAENTTPLYPFGYGLSYTTFEYAQLSISHDDLMIGESTAINFIVQLYIRDPVCSVTRPVKELRGFEKVQLSPGEIKEVSFQLSTDDLRFYDQHMEYVVEPGKFEIMIGSSSEDIKLRGAIHVSY